LRLLSQALETAHTIGGIDSEGEFLIDITDHKVDILTKIAGCYTELGEKKEALRLLSLAQEKATDIECAADDFGDLLDYGFDGTYGSWMIMIADKYAEAGEKKEAADCLSSVIEYASFSRSYSSNENLAEIVDRYADNGQLKQALEALEEMSYGEYTSVDKGEQLARFANRCVEAGHFTEAFNTAMALGDSHCGVDTFTFNMAVDKFAETGNKQNTARVLSRAITAATTFKQAVDRAEALIRIAIKFAEAGPQPSNEDFATFNEIIATAQPYKLI
jgi:tetratricopeptide (TPR) repeat protein